METTNSLTRQQESFCFFFVEMKDAKEAYRMAFHAQEMPPAKVKLNAAELMNTAGITNKIKELQEEAAGEAKATLADHLNVFTGVKRPGMERGEFNRGCASGDCARESVRPIQFLTVQ